MFPERNERPSTAGEAEERSGYMELCEVGPGLFDREKRILPEIIFKGLES